MEDCGSPWMLDQSDEVAGREEQFSQLLNSKYTINQVERVVVSELIN